MPTRHAHAPDPADMPPESDEERKAREDVAAAKAAEPLQEEPEGPKGRSGEFVTPRQAQGDPRPAPREPDPPAPPAP